MEASGLVGSESCWVREVIDCLTLGAETQDEIGCYVELASGTPLCDE